MHIIKAQSCCAISCIDCRGIREFEKDFLSSHTQYIPTLGLVSSLPKQLHNTTSITEGTIVMASQLDTEAVIFCTIGISCNSSYKSKIRLDNQCMDEGTTTRHCSRTVLDDTVNNAATEIGKDEYYPRFIKLQDTIAQSKMNRVCKWPGRFFTKLERQEKCVSVLYIWTWM